MFLVVGDTVESICRNGLSTDEVCYLILFMYGTKSWFSYETFLLYLSPSSQEKNGMRDGRGSKDSKVWCSFVFYFYLTVISWF